MSDALSPQPIATIAGALHRTAWREHQVATYDNGHMMQVFYCSRRFAICKRIACVYMNLAVWKEPGRGDGAVPRTLGIDRSGFSLS